MASDRDDRKSVARGYLETKMAEGAEQQEMMEEREEALAYAMVEEDEQRIKEMLSRGVISDEEARRLRARAKMRKQADGAKKVDIDSRKLAGAGVISTEQLLEEALNQPQKNLIVETLRRLLFIERLEVAISKEKRRRAHPEFKHRFPSIDNLVNYGMSFELAMFVMVSANAILTGVQISVKGTPAQDDPIFRILEEVFTITFVVEVILRVMADGWIWFTNMNNFLDFALIMGTGVVPTFLGAALNLSNNPVLRCGQALRCLRLIRILRTVRARFPILWALISGVVGSARILLWTLTLMFTVLYMFSIFGVQLMQKSDLHFSPSMQVIVDVHFPDVIGGMFTLFQIITLDSWTSISRPLQHAYTLIGVYFLLYVAVSCMVLNNLVVAVICENAFKTVGEDVELQAALQKEETEAQLDTLRAIFEEMDADQSDSLSQEEYEAFVAKNEEIVFNLKVANLVEDEIMNLWELMDFPAKINKEHFANRMRSLKGECKAKDSYKVVVTLTKLLKRVDKASNNLRIAVRTCQRLKEDAALVQQELAMTLSHVQGFVATVTRCIPPDAIPATVKKVKAVEAEMTAKVAPLLQPLIHHDYQRAPLAKEAYAKACGLPSTNPEPLPQLDNIDAHAGVGNNNRNSLAPISDDVELM